MGSSEDPLRPEDWQSSEILARSRSTWQLPSSCCNVKTPLNNTPSIPHASSNVIEFVDNSNVSLEGFSKGTVAPGKSSNPRCELPATKQALPPTRLHRTSVRSPALFGNNSYRKGLSRASQPRTWLVTCPLSSPDRIRPDVSRRQSDL